MKRLFTRREYNARTVSQIVYRMSYRIARAKLHYATDSSQWIYWYSMAENIRKIPEWRTIYRAAELAAWNNR